MPLAMGKLLIYFAVGKNVLSKPFNEPSLNRFIIADHSFWPFLMRFATQLGQFSVALSCLRFTVDGPLIPE